MDNTNSAMSKKQIPSKPTDQDFENFRMYHQLQYDRIDKLESKRESFSDFTIGISTATYVFGFEQLKDSIDLSIINGVLLPIIVVIINISAIIFASKSRKFIKLHQKRAKASREVYAPTLNQINNKVGKPDSNQELLRRGNIYKIIHIMIILITLVIVLEFILQQNGLSLAN